MSAQRKSWNELQAVVMKTDYQHLKNPAFWPPLGCELGSIEKQGELEIATVRDLLCGDSFTLTIKHYTTNDIYRMLKMRRTGNLQ